jgi:copper chaperone NosL
VKGWRSPGLKPQGSIVLLGLLLLVACQSRPPAPAALDSGHDACGYCRMVVSDQRFASQVIAPYEEPRFFDDLGHYLTGASPLPARARVYVADHRTKAWIPAEHAVYTRVDTLTAPMGSHLVAHESTASRDADPVAEAGVPVDFQTVFGGRPAGGRP